MTQFTDNSLYEPLDEFAWDPEEVRDLVQTTPLRYDEDGIPADYMAGQLFGLEGAYLGSHSL
jgi:hypothetical protein